MHADSIKPGKSFDFRRSFATGGLLQPRNLIERQGVVIGAAFIIELVDLKGRDKLQNLPVLPR